MDSAERNHPVLIASYEDINADFACDSINMENFHSAMFIITIHVTAAAACYIKLYSGAMHGALDSALTFRYAFGGAAKTVADCDKLDAKLTSANLSFAAGTKDDYMLIIEIDSSEMDVTNQEEWLTLKFLDTDGGLTGRVSAIAILKPRYTQARAESALA